MEPQCPPTSKKYCARYRGGEQRAPDHFDFSSAANQPSTITEVLLGQSSCGIFYISVVLWRTLVPQQMMNHITLHVAALLHFMAT